MTRYRAAIFCNDRLELISEWKTTREEAIGWVTKEARGWTCPQGKHFLVESKLKRPRYTVCPHCRGRLEKTAEWNDYPYDCCRCGRGWRIDSKKRWHALFSGGMEVYSREEVRDEQRHKKILEWRTAT